MSSLPSLQIKKNIQQISTKYSMFKTKHKVFHKKLLMHLRLTATNDPILKANIEKRVKICGRNIEGY